MRRCATIIIGDVMKKKISVCENSMVLVYILAMSGGFMDAYSYMCRGEVFANAQTGNILLMAVNLAKGNFVVALRYFAPVMAFISYLQGQSAPQTADSYSVRGGGTLCGGIYTV